MSETPTVQVTGVVRRRRPWLAFLLNLFWCPGGYVYAGFPWVGTLFILIAFALGELLFFLSIADPPGIYGDPWAVGRSLGQWLIGGYLISALLGAHAAMLCRGPPRWSGRGLRLWLAVLASFPLMLLLSLASRAFSPVSLYVVASASMEPTLSVGDFVAVKGARALCGDKSVRPGDVVLIKASVSSGAPTLKRAVATQGQVVEMKGGELVLDGAAIQGGKPYAVHAPFDRYGPVTEALSAVETLPGGASYRTLKFPAGFAPQIDMPPFRMPSNFWFVLGDNRDNSMDSRMTGPVPSKAICGVAFKIIYSKDPGRIGRRP